MASSQTGKIVLALNEADCQLVRSALEILDPDDPDVSDHRDHIIIQIDKFLEGNHRI